MIHSTPNDTTNSGGGLLTDPTQVKIPDHLFVKTSSDLRGFPKSARDGERCTN